MVKPRVPRLVEVLDAVGALTNVAGDADDARLEGQERAERMK
jgi:hypothetical protein